MKKTMETIKNFILILSVAVQLDTGHGMEFALIRNTCDTRSMKQVPCQHLISVRESTGPKGKCLIFCAKEKRRWAEGVESQCLQGDPTSPQVVKCKERIEKGLERLTVLTSSKRKRMREPFRARGNQTKEEGGRLIRISDVLKRIDHKDLEQFKKDVLEKNVETFLYVNSSNLIDMHKNYSCSPPDGFECYSIKRAIDDSNEKVLYVQKAQKEKDKSTWSKDLLSDAYRREEGTIETATERGFLIHYPIESRDWSNLTDPSQIKCPSHQGDRLRKSGTLRNVDLEIIVRRPRPGNFKTAVPGYICQGMQWTSTCNEMWYFVTYHDRAVKTITPNEVKCLQNIQSHKRGEDVRPYYPLEECNWNAETTKTVDYHMITPYSPLVDPFTLEFKSEIFLESSSCSPGDKFCLTDDTSRIWFPDQDDPLIALGHCQDTTWDESFLTVHPEEIPRNWSDPNSTWTNDLILKGILFGEKRVSKSCILEFCGELGLLFEDGEWWEINVFSKEQHRSRLTKQFLEEEKLERCTGTESRIGVVGKETDEKALLDAALRRSGYEKCKAARYRLIENRNLRLDDLSYINPRDSVNWWSYRVRAEDSDRLFRLEKAISLYRLVQVTPKLLKGGQVCEDKRNCSLIIGYHKGKEIKSSDWEETGHDGVYIGVNGLIRRDTRNVSYIYYPPLIKEYEEMFSDSGEIEDEAFIFQPEIHSKKTKPKSDDQDSSTDSKKNKTPIDDLEDWWKKLKSEWGAIKGTLIGVTLIVGLILLLKLILAVKRLISRKRGKKSEAGKEEKEKEMVRFRATPNIYEEIDERSPTRPRGRRTIFT
ncbi:glycoprotein [Iriri virus]|uniref:Glycoprotein n=1 Tax=Iriri virus TaxID=1620893 RepID=A0A0D3R113_9RHAB|nr:glycoprotein [Iriri virus]AJR28374.1 glycoprotein [Iriri virus]